MKLYNIKHVIKLYNKSFLLCGPYVVTRPCWTPIFECYMARFIVEIKHIKREVL